MKEELVCSQQDEVSSLSCYTHLRVLAMKLSRLVIRDAGHTSFEELWLAHGASAALARVGWPLCERSSW